VGALGHIGSPRAIPTLRVRLSDSSMHVAMTAAYWLGELAAPLRNNNPQQADQITAELWKAQNNQINNRDKDAIAFRAACIEAIGKLKDPKLDESILRLGEQAQEPVGVRVAAYRALASTHNRRASIRIARDIQNENPANKEVRIAEVNALAATGKFEEEANFLYDLTQSTEPDPQVRAAAWDAFKTLLPTATDFSTLTDWSARLSNDPARQLAVLDTLTEKLKEANRMNDWAPAEQNRGAALMALAQHDPSTAALTHYNQAATAFLAAVDFWNKSGQQVAALPGLAKQAIEALLEAHDYSRACTFAADQLKVTPLLNQFLGPEIRDYADRLVSDGKANRDPQKLRDAIDLIEQATKIDPPLEKPVLSDLNQFKADAENALRVLPKPQ
jgi:HEAT repeat protein